MYVNVVRLIYKDGLYTAENIWIAVRINRFSLLCACVRLCFLITGYMHITKCDVNTRSNGPTSFGDLMLPVVLGLALHDKQITVT